MEVAFIGCGDAWGSGGRFNTCFLLTGARCRILVDCGASSLVALKRAGISPNLIDGVVLSHLHGDHFGGLPFLLLDAHHMSRRERPFFILGPRGTAARVAAACEALYPGMTETKLRFPLAIEEAATGARARAQRVRGHVVCRQPFGRGAVPRVADRNGRQGRDLLGRYRLDRRAHRSGPRRRPLHLRMFEL